MPLVLLGSASFVAWFISMLAGGGSPFILIPLITVLFGSQAVAPVITTGLLVGNTQRALFFWREIDWHITGWYLPGAIAGAILGCYTFSQIHLEGLQILLGLALILMGVNYWIGQKERTFPVRAWYFLPISFLNAFGSGLIGSTGPVMNPVYLNYGLVKEQMVATKALNKAALHLVKLLTYLVLGVLNSDYILYGLVIGAAAVPANWLGKMVLERMSPEQFRQAVLTFVAVSGVWMVWGQRELFLVW